MTIYNKNDIIHIYNIADVTRCVRMANSEIFLEDR